MHALLDLQASFAAALFDSADSRVLHWIDEAGMSAGERLAVYRRNVFHNYHGALRDVYPVVERLVGEAFFEFAAGEYVRRHRSTQGNLHAYGERFAEFLGAFVPAASLSYLPDVARLEWAMHESFHAADRGPLDPLRLGGLTVEELPHVTFVLHPACRLLRSPYPVHAIWEANQAGRDGRADLGTGGVHLLVRRSGHAVQLEPVGDAEYAMLEACAAGHPLAAALDAARRECVGFDLGAFLARRVSDATVSEFRLSDVVMEK
jgi:hypothetical protein